MASAQCSPPASGDWIVNETVSCSSETIVLKGSLLIRGLGNLTLEDSVLQFNSTSDGEYGIEVNSSLYVLGSTIESLSKAYTFVSNTGAILEIRDSYIYDCGYSGGIADPKKGGLYVGSDGVNITNTTFTDNFIALLVYSKNNKITNNKILSNMGSFSVNGSGNVITGNVIKHNPLFGYGIKGENLKFEHNVVENNTGITFISDNSVINNNSFFNNMIWGLTVSGENNNVTNNLIKSNNISSPGSTGIGLGIADSENARVVGNTILENGIGLKLYQTKNTLVKDNLCNKSDEYDVYLLSSENITFDNTNYMTLVKSWQLDVTVVDTDGDPVEDADAVIKDNFTTTAFSDDTDSDGVVETSLKETLENESGVFSFSPYSMNVTKSGYTGNFTEFNLTGDLSLEMTINSTGGPPGEGNFTFMIVSPINKTYIKKDLTANGSLKLEVTSEKNMSSCNYSINNTSGSLSKINPRRFRAYKNMSGMEGSYRVTFECVSIESVVNYSRVYFTLYPSRGCINNDDCASTQKCTNSNCVNLDCECGYASNHVCVDYDCCKDDDCEEDDEFCDTDTHECEEVQCECSEKISNHKCNVEPDYCCKDLQCGENKTCVSNECIERLLSFTIPENLVLGQNISILVMDQNDNLVNNVRIDVKYIDADPVITETYYTNSEGVVEIPIRHQGRVDFVARKGGYFTNHHSGETPEPFNFFFLIEVIVLIGCIAGISIIGFKFLKRGGLSGKGPLKLEKTVSGNLAALEVKNTTGKKLQNITIRDSVPRGAFIRCNVSPKVEPFDETADILTWEILELDPKEEVTIEYETRQANRGFSVTFEGKEYKV
ncbi:MAG: right-handed parallel beta-helix repeat-containing protein [Candidatus Aenigmarchaeota archaeon]